jgi:hypothetical protein
MGGVRCGEGATPTRRLHSPRGVPRVIPPGTEAGPSCRYARHVEGSPPSGAHERPRPALRGLGPLRTWRYGPVIRLARVERIHPRSSLTRPRRRDDDGTGPGTRIGMDPAEQPELRRSDLDRPVPGAAVPHRRVARPGGQDLRRGLLGGLPAARRVGPAQRQEAFRHRTSRSVAVTITKAVVIGGGEIARPGYPVETTALDAEVVRLPGKRPPRVVFLPTATQDVPVYVTTVKEHYAQRLGRHVEPLTLYDRARTAGRSSG